MFSLFFFSFFVLCFFRSNTKPAPAPANPAATRAARKRGLCVCLCPVSLFFFFASLLYLLLCVLLVCLLLRLRLEEKEKEEKNNRRKTKKKFFFCFFLKNKTKVRDDAAGSPSSPVPAPVFEAPAAAPPVLVTWVGERVGSCHFLAAQFGGRVYHVGDTVLLQSGMQLPFVCRIERMIQKGPKKVMMVRWMLRPADVDLGLLGRDAYPQELFITDVVEENDIATIVSRCFVLSPGAYARLPTALYESNVFCCCMMFDGRREAFVPLDLQKLGPLYSEPPCRAPRINMPAIPLSGVPFANVSRVQKKKRKPNVAAVPAVWSLCCIDKCPNVCWSKTNHASALASEWSFRPRGGKFVCEEHMRKDRRLRTHKRSRSTSDEAKIDEEDKTRLHKR